MKKKVVAVIQARLGSTRLPCKMMLALHGRPIIEWVVRRVRGARLLDDLVAAIPDTSMDQVLARELQRLEVSYVRGPEHDVLRRFILAAEFSGATHVVRVCADNPVISGHEIDNLISFYESNPCDYAYNHVPKGNTYPDGLGAEMLSFDLLKRLDQIATNSAHREHCLSYISDHPGEFRIMTFDPPDPRVANPRLKLDVDTIEDYRNMALRDFEINTTPSELVRIFAEQI